MTDQQDAQYGPIVDALEAAGIVLEPPEEPLPMTDEEAERIRVTLGLPVPKPMPPDILRLLAEIDAAR